MEQANAKMEEHGCCKQAGELRQKLQQMRERTRVEAKPASVLTEVVSLDAFLGVQLKLDLQLPMVQVFLVMPVYAFLISVASGILLPR